MDRGFNRFKIKIRSLIDKIKRRRRRLRRINSELKKLNKIIKKLSSDDDLILSSPTGQKAFLDTYRQSADIARLGTIPIIVLMTIHKRFDELRIAIMKNDPYSPFGSIENVKKFAGALGNFFVLLGFILDDQKYEFVNKNFYSLNQLLKLKATKMFLPFVREELASWSAYYRKLFSNPIYMDHVGGKAKKRIYDRLTADYPDLFN